MDPAFGERLRLERERRRITLDSIAANTKIGLPLLQGLERGNVSRWPSGIYRRSFIRSYAEAIGLAPDEIAREFLERFPDPADVPARTPAKSAPSTGLGKTAPPASDEAGLRLQLAESGAAPTRGTVIGGMPARCAAVACDAFVLAAIGLMLYIAFNQFWMPFAIAVLAYYSASILVLGNTPGVSLLAETSVHGRAARDASSSSRLKTVGFAIRQLSARLSEVASR